MFMVDKENGEKKSRISSMIYYFMFFVLSALFLSYMILYH